MPTARVVAGRYHLIRPIGRGSAAVVYVARRADGGPDVALKLIPARPGLLPREVQTFQQELGATLRVAHPGIAPIRDAGYDGDVLYLAMDLLHGETLRDRFGRRDADPAAAEAATLDALEQALEPLSAAHQAGVVHADLSPSNVFVARHRTGDEQVQLLDVGLARLLVARALAAPGSAIGAPRSMAPEQLTGGRISPATDVWAFGVMLYEALAGAPPFDYAHVDALVHHVTQAPHPPLDRVRDDVDPSMARLVDLCLEKDPARRPPDGRALLRLMKTLRGGLNAIARGPRGEGVSLDTVIDPSGAAPPPPPEELELALRRSPRDPEAHRALLRHYEGEDNADGVWLAATALDFLGEASREEIRLHHHYRRPPAIEADRGVDAGGWAALLHPDQDPRIDAVWTVLADAIAAMHRQPDDALGLDRAKKLDVARPKDELEQAFARAVGALRPNVLPRLYRTRGAGPPPEHLPAHPPASLFPRGFEEPLPLGALRFAVGRHVAHYRSSHRVCTYLHEPEALEAMFDAGLRIGLGWAAEREDQARLADVLRQHVAEARLPAVAVECARLGTSARRVDLGTWRRAVELSCARAGLLLAADLEGASWMLRWNRERRRIPPEDAMDDLLTFWTSGAHVRLRHMLGLAVRKG